MSRPRRCALALVLLVSLAAVPVSAQPARFGGSPRAFSPQSRMLVLLSAWLGRTLPESWLRGGAYLDASGKSLVVPVSEGGCMVDPSGRCAPITFSEAGCMVDPSGNCASGH